MLEMACLNVASEVANVISFWKFPFRDCPWIQGILIVINKQQRSTTQE